METLNEFETEIAKLETLQPDERRMFSEPISEDGSEWSVPVPEFDSLEIECAARLREASVEIRRRLWSGPYQQWAGELHRRADESAAKLEQVAGLPPASRLPRFPAVHDGSRIVAEDID